ncbi:MAG TPA: hypothetical protein PL193_12775 [Xanthobacteraceae bacterium]|nr:hypothetical protein [Xanthobacteraceae bacterium]
MARKPTTKAKPAARKRATPRPKPVAAPSQNNWKTGAAIFALAAVLGAGAYMLSISLDQRTTVAELVQRFEVPAATNEQAVSPADADTEQGSIESAPTR